MRRPLLILLVAFAAGALSGGAALLEAAGLLLVLAAALLALALSASGRAAPAALAAAAFALGAAGAAVEAAGYARAPLREWLERRGDDEDPVRVEGVAAGDGRILDGRLLLILDVERVTSAGRVRPLTGRARIDVGGESTPPAVRQGDRLALWSTLRLPRGFATPGAYDAEAHARRQRVHVLGYCKSARLVESAGDPRGLAAWLGRLRGAARRRIEAHVLAGPERELVKAMALGDRSGLDEETLEAFRAAGTYHVLALSGAQVALVAALLIGSMRRGGATPFTTAVGAGLAIGLYVAFVGAEVPVTRAALMAIVLLSGRALDLDADLANLLALAGLVVLLLRPSAIGDVSFQLSFLATLGLVLYTPPIVARLPALPLQAQLGIAASLAAQLVLAPLLILHFHRLAPAALVLNVVAVPLSAAVLLAGFGVVAAGGLGAGVAGMVGDAAWIAAHALLRTGDLVKLAPFLDMRLPSPPAWAVGVFAAGLIGTLLRRRTPLALLLVGIGFLGLCAGAAPPADARLHVSFLDVGQGDAIAVRSASGRVWMVDAGGSFDSRFDVGEAVVAPFLWAHGVRRIEDIVVSHAHPDHAGGVPALLRGFRVASVWEGLAARRDAGYARLDEALSHAAVTRLAVARGCRANWDGVRVEVKGPGAPRAAPWRVRNDDSVVLRLTLGQVSFLLTGDVEAAGENAFEAGEATVLKVAHHGSRSSSSDAFLGRVRAPFAVISAGHRNRFGHPHPDVLASLARARCQVFRTDRDGTVTFSTDGSRLWVRTERARIDQRLR